MSAREALIRAGFEGEALDVALGVGFAESGTLIDGKPVAYLDAVGDCYQIIPSYTIQPDESLAVAAQYFTTPGVDPWRKVAEFNGIDPPYTVQPADVIWNPDYKQRFDMLDKGIRGLYPQWVGDRWQDPEGNPVWGPSVGWFQVRVLHDPNAYGPFVEDHDGNQIAVRDLRFLDGTHEAVKTAEDAQAAAALVISRRGEDWTPWTAYRSGAWKRLSEAGHDDYELVIGHPRAGRWNLAGTPQRSA